MNLAVAQFEPKDGDKSYNLSVIRELTKKAKSQGDDLISFHEMSITAYTHTKNLSLEEITSLAEEIPNNTICQYWPVLWKKKETRFSIHISVLQRTE